MRGASPAVINLGVRVCRGGRSECIAYAGWACEWAITCVRCTTIQLVYDHAAGFRKLAAHLGCKRTPLPFCGLIHQPLTAKHVVRHHECRGLLLQPNHRRRRIHGGAPQDCEGGERAAAAAALAAGTGGRRRGAVRGGACYLRVWALGARVSATVSATYGISNLEVGVADACQKCPPEGPHLYRAMPAMGA